MSPLMVLFSGVANDRPARKETNPQFLSLDRVEPELIALRRFRAGLGAVPSTACRWIQRGWLGQPLNIAGRLYLTREQIAEFKRRAAAGEFAASIRPPRPTRR